ncbi:hypothetical protein [Teredinibacter turnerae]|uniref:hypothetical protein n=1 Tax=Teredinibacter turnerae TaxID=2426 RepID=UPI00037ECC38|nr:hypothetical protein [Teredinibacter turnerae]
MEKNDLRDLEAALGIASPWSIKSIKVNEKDHAFDVFLEVADQKRLFGFLDSYKRSQDVELVSGSWQYMSLGTFTTIIHADIPRLGNDNENVVGPENIIQPAFLGHPSRQYSNFVRQRVALGQIKGLDSSVIAETINIDESLVSLVLSDIAKSNADIRTLSCLPTEVDPVWERILRDQVLLRTTMLPLKFLLSKLKLTATKITDSRKILPLVCDLRDFFVEHVAAMDSEVDQVCGITTERQQQYARAAKSRHRLVLPSVKSPVWLDVLSGRITLNSQSVPLNLLISRQRSNFVQGRTKEEKIEAIETLREYFRKNYRTLKAELLLLNRAMNIRQKSGVELPDPEHAVWQQILNDDTLVPSSHIAYKLLLAKLRAQVTTKPDPVVKLEAARRIREFLSQNQKSMREELNLLLKQTAAVV